MQTILEALRAALELLVSFDPVLLQIVTLSLQVSISALLISTIIGIPIGAGLGL